MSTDKSIGAMPTDALAQLAMLAVGLVAVAIYIMQITRIRSRMAAGDLAMPLCRTFADLVRGVTNVTELYPLLENSRFRSCHVAVYSPDGEVYMDGLQPCFGQLPMPPSERQRDTFRALVEKGVLEPKNTTGVETRLFRQCTPASDEYDTNTVCGVFVNEEARKLVVVVDVCGNEG
jgi:hypothetical protein